MSGSTTYKQYQRTQRIIRTEDDYSGGMMYVNTPLDTGYSRIILNLDLAENSAGLKPRAGLKTTAYTSYLTYSDGIFNTFHPYFVANSVMRRTSDDAIKYTDTVVLENRVYSVGPYSPEETEYIPITELSSDTKLFEKDKAHCFAWQGDLYHMHEDGLWHFNEKLVDGLIQHSHEKVTPRALTPKEAVTTGYNMLSATPYHFSDSPSVAVGGDILGILPYTVGENNTVGDLALTTPGGRSVWLRVYLAVTDSPDVTYQYLIQWRESTQGTWTDIAKSDPWDENSREGVTGADILKDGICVKWPLPETRGLPIYIRVQLRVASENNKIYQISEASTIPAGLTLGAGTNVPRTPNDISIKYTTGAYNTFPTPVDCKIGAGTEFGSASYISYYKGTKGLLEGPELFAAAKYSVERNQQGVVQNSTWGLFYSSTQSIKFITADGDEHGPEYFKNVFYEYRDDETPNASPSEDRPVHWFKLPEGVTCTGHVGGVFPSYFTLKGPVAVYVVPSFMDDYVIIQPLVSFARTSTTLVNVDIAGPCTLESDLKYTIGAGTQFVDGTVLNDAQAFQTHTFIASPADSVDGYYIETALSKVAPVTSVVSFVFKPDSVNAVIKYDLTTAKGMCYWKDRLVLWGVASPETTTTQYQEDSANLLFFSELNDPSYFPYPQNVNTFTEPILKALPFGDDLLVITATSMHLIMLNEDGLTWSATQIQSNLRFNEDEMYLVQVVNNMVLFKSGPQFYLLVPSTTNVGNLVVAPITKNIKQIFDNPKKFREKLFTQIFAKTTESAILEALTSDLEWKLNTFLDFEQIHITYTAQTNFVDTQDGNRYWGIRPTLDFIYNTTSRTWKVYLYTAPIGFYPIRRDAVKGNTYIAYWGHISLNDIARDFYFTNAASFQYCTFDPSIVADDIELGFDQVMTFSNLHYLDTGPRNQDPAYNKRYREAQLRITNHTTEALKLITEYTLDGTVYIPLYAPEASISIGEDGTASVNLQYGDTPTVTGSAVLSGESDIVTSDDGEGVTVIQGYSHSTTDNTFSFMLTAGSESRLESPFTLKLRTTILGKGYAPSLRILSRNETEFTILDHTWVYRIMNAR